jgi:hypothetical protein
MDSSIDLIAQVTEAVDKILSTPGYAGMSEEARN